MGDDMANAYRELRRLKQEEERLGKSRRVGFNCDEDIVSDPSLLNTVNVSFNEKPAIQTFRRKKIVSNLKTKELEEESKIIRDWLFEILNDEGNDIRWPVGCEAWYGKEQEKRQADKETKITIAMNKLTPEEYDLLREEWEKRS